MIIKHKIAALNVYPTKVEVKVVCDVSLSNVSPTGVDFFAISEG